MPKNQNIESFYHQKFDELPSLPPIGAGDFNVFSLAKANGDKIPAPYSRYDFFKVMLIKGEHRCHYAEKSITIKGNTLLFFNAKVPYRFELLTKNAMGYFCIFKESFFSGSYRSGISSLPVFIPGSKSVYTLNKEQVSEVTSLFEKMIEENSSDYKYKYDLIRNYVSEIIHFAMKMDPNEQLYPHPDSNARITSVFLNLLESQFPIESLEYAVKMRSASDFANRLGLHVNHLNRAVRATTGKTTSQQIAERMVTEATALLKHSDWNIADISYSLGFAQPAHFTYFFKKHTNTTPTALRLI